MLVAVDSITCDKRARLCGITVYYYHLWKMLVAVWCYFMYAYLRRLYVRQPHNIDPESTGYWKFTSSILWDHFSCKLTDFCVFFRAEGATLTVRSLRFLQLAPHDLDAFASIHKHTPLKRQVCFSIILVNSQFLTSNIVLNRINGGILNLDPAAPILSEQSLCIF